MMTDPLSISAGVLAILGAIKVVYRGFDAFKNASQEVEDITQELDDIYQVLTVLAACLNQSTRVSEAQHSANTHLQSLLRKTEVVVHGLQQSLQQHNATSSRPSILALDRNSIVWIRDRSNLRRRCDHLKRLREQISLATSNLILSTLIQTESAITQVSEAIPLSNQSLKAQISLGLSQVETAQRDSTSIIINNLDQLSAELQPLIRQRYNTMFPYFPNMNEGIDNARFSTVLIPRAELQSYGCWCQCHAAQGFAAPNRLKVAFGDLKFTLNPSKPCTEVLCKRRQCPGVSNSTSLAWMAPGWSLVQRAVLINLAIAYRPPTISASISFPRIVGDDALVFHYATIGDVDGMKRLFQDGLASPHDIKNSNGFTAFHYAVSAGRLDICKLLIQSNGKPTLQTNAAMSAAERAVNAVFSNRMDQKSTTELISLFNLYNLIKWRKFTVIHELILGIRCGSLQTMLKENYLCIDQPDSMGRTPLSWAAQRGDHKSVAILVQHLADPSAKDISGITPIHYAAQAGNVDSMRYLLAANHSNVGMDNDRGWTPLHHAAFFQNDPVVIELLVDNGADVDEQTSNGKTALILSAINNTFRCAECLIRRGSQVNLKSDVGWSPLNVAITSRSIETLRVLIQSGAELKESFWGQENMLHMLARYPELDMFKCCMNADFRGLEIDARNCAGDTPVDVLRQQKPTSDQLESFQQLLMKVIADNKEILDDLDIEERFEDALEYQAAY